MKMMDGLLRKTIQKMKDDGVTRKNAVSRKVHIKYSTSTLHVDSLGRIQMVLYFKDFDIQTIRKLQTWDVKFNVVGIYKGNREDGPQSYFKKLRVPVVINYGESPTEIDCQVPFDVVEEVAKLPTLVRLNAFLIGVQD